MLKTGNPVLPPMQWTAFTLDQHDDATVRTGTGIGSLHDLESINAQVNSGISPHQEPMSSMSVLDRWRLWPAIAWCGDYAVTKRHELLAKGWPSSALLLAECVTAMGEEHAVLMARMPSGDLVLDNRVDVLRSPDKTGYRWVKMQGAADPNFWFETKHD